MLFLLILKDRTIFILILKFLVFIGKDRIEFIKGNNNSNVR